MIRLFNSVSLFSSSFILPLITESANSYALITSFNFDSMSFLLFSIVSFKLDIAVSKLAWTLSIASRNVLSANNNSFFKFVIASFNTSYVTYVLSNESRTSCAFWIFIVNWLIFSARLSFVLFIFSIDVCNCSINWLTWSIWLCNVLSSIHTAYNVIPPSTIDKLGMVNILFEYGKSIGLFP